MAGPQLGLGSLLPCSSVAYGSKAAKPPATVGPCPNPIGMLGSRPGPRPVRPGSASPLPSRLFSATRPAGRVRASPACPCPGGPPAAQAKPPRAAGVQSSGCGLAWGGSHYSRAGKPSLRLAGLPALLSVRSPSAGTPPPSCAGAGSPSGGAAAACWPPCFALCAPLRFLFVLLLVLLCCLVGSPLLPPRPCRPRWGLPGSAGLIAGLRPPAVGWAPLGAFRPAALPPSILAGAVKASGAPALTAPANKWARVACRSVLRQKMA